VQEFLTLAVIIFRTAFQLKPEYKERFFLLN
jgi:hypothetical protein